jgi:hypothetical protein
MPGVAPFTDGIVRAVRFLSPVYTLGARALLGLLLRREPGMKLTLEKRTAFAALAERLLRARGETVPWDLPYPRHEFTRWLVRNHPVLLHGSPAELPVLEPAQQTDFRGQRVTAVFATDDGIWPMFFATLDRSRTPGRWSLRNAALVVGQGSAAPRYYLFSVDRATKTAEPFGPGFLHVVPKETFHPASDNTVHFPEWVSPEAVKPLARIPVGPADFPFRTRIAGHRWGELFPLTWMLYRWRTR